MNAVPGHTGYKAQLWKVVTQDGKQVSREIFNKSTYQMTPEIVTVGTAGNVTDELKSAMESGDVSAIKTAAANAKNGTSAAASADAAAAAQKAAQDAYAAALAQGMDTNSAMQAAQSAAQQAVSNLQSGAQSSDSQLRQDRTEQRRPAHSNEAQ